MTLLLASQDSLSGGGYSLNKTVQEIVAENTWCCRSKLEEGALERTEDRLIYTHIPGPRCGVFLSWTGLHMRIDKI